MGENEYFRSPKRIYSPPFEKTVLPFIKTHPRPFLAILGIPDRSTLFARPVVGQLGILDRSTLFYVPVVGYRKAQRRKKILRISILAITSSSELRLSRFKLRWIRI